MPRRRPPSLLVAWLAVVIPLITLGVFAWRGIEAQAHSIRREKQAELEYQVKRSAKELSRRFQESVVEFGSYPDPPRPGSPAEEDDILDGSDRDALAALRDRPDAGFSPGGLPRRVLAALRLMELAPDGASLSPAEVAAMGKLVIDECPSILTSLVLEKLLPASVPELDQWESRMAAVEVLRRHPEGGLIKDDGDLWLGIHGDRIRYLDPKVMSDALRDVTGEGYRSHLTREPAQGGMSDGDFVSASAKVEMGDGFWLHLQSVVPSHFMIDAALRNQKKWAASLLGVAALVSFGGLFMLHRTLRRERQLNEMKSQFVASVSHELRAPVASIRLMADALEAGKVSPETAKEFHRLIAREGARLSTLVGNVLDHARIEQGRKVWKMEPCDLSSLVADTVRVMEPLAHEKGIVLKQELSPVEGIADADAIQQALVNLLDNAIKFSPPGAIVTTLLVMDGEHRHWSLSVRDEGPGIPKQEQSRIFERFYRPGDELRRETQGTGIGLSLVKSIVEAHHGTVTVESETGRGSAFTLTFPLSA